MAGVVDCKRDELSYVIVIQRVEDKATVPPIADKAGLPEQTQLMRYRRLADSDGRGDIADAEFRCLEGPNYAESRGVGECGEKGRDAIKFVWRKPR